MDINHFENLSISYNRELDAFYIVCINDTRLGTAIGGCRLKQYDNLQSAIDEAKKLAQTMTLKCAFSKLPMGGGKAIIFHSNKSLKKREKLFSDFSEYLMQFDKKYITSVDEGVSSRDLETIAKRSNQVIGMNASHDPSYYTALGVFNAIRGSAKSLFGTDKLKGVKIAIKGVGKVGYHLLTLLHKEDAIISIADIDEKILNKCKKEFGVAIESTEKIHLVESDFFVPCSSSGTITSKLAQEIKTKIICGSENCQIYDDEAEGILNNRGILYLPDYVVNSGGVICAAYLLGNITENEMEVKIDNLYNEAATLCKTYFSTGIKTTRLAENQARKNLLYSKRVDFR